MARRGVKLLDAQLDMLDMSKLFKELKEIYKLPGVELEKERVPPQRDLTDLLTPKSLASQASREYRDLGSGFLAPLNTRKEVARAEAGYEQWLSLAGVRGFTLAAPVLLIDVEKGVGGVAYAGFKADVEAGGVSGRARGEGRVTRYERDVFESSAVSGAEISLLGARDASASVIAVAERGKYKEVKEGEETRYELVEGLRTLATGGVKGKNVEASAYGVSLLGEAYLGEKAGARASARAGSLYVRSLEEGKPGELALTAQAVRELVREGTPTTVELGSAGTYAKWEKGVVTLWGSAWGRIILSE